MELEGDAILDSANSAKGKIETGVNTAYLIEQDGSRDLNMFTLVEDLSC